MDKLKYFIIRHLWSVDIVDLSHSESEYENLLNQKYIKLLNKQELDNLIKDLLKENEEVWIGTYIFKWRKWRFIPNTIIRKIENEIIYKEVDIPKKYRKK